MTEKKLKQACEDLEHRTVTINKLTDALRSVVLWNTDYMKIDLDIVVFYISNLKKSFFFAQKEYLCTHFLEVEKLKTFFFYQELLPTMYLALHLLLLAVVYYQNYFCRELEVEKKNMNEEINMLEQQLQDEQEASDDKTKRMSKLEKDIRDLRVQLEQKIEIG